MSEVTVKQLAETVGIPIDRLLSQLKEAGMSIADPDQVVTGQEKRQLLEHLQRLHGKEEPVTAKKITLRRPRVTSELKVTAGQGKTKTISVQVRKKRTVAAAPEAPAEIETISVPDEVS